MKKHNVVKYSSILLCFLFVSLISFSCQLVERKSNPAADLRIILIKKVDLPVGWEIETPAVYYNSGDYAEESVKIVFVPMDGPRKAAAQYVDRFRNAKLAKHRFRTDYLQEPLNSGGFIPAGWNEVHSEADEEKFICYLRKLTGETEQSMICEWQARYDENIVYFVSWILPDLMDLNNFREVIIKIDRNILKWNIP